MLDWPLIRCNACYTGSNESEIKPPLRLIWKERVRQAEQCLISGDRLVLSTETAIAVLDQHSGAEIWRRDNSSFCGYDGVGNMPIAACRDRLFLKTENHLCSCQLSTGKDIFTMSLPGVACGPQFNTTMDGTVLYARRAGVDIDTKQIIDYNALFPSGFVSRILSNGKVIVCGNGGGEDLWCISRTPNGGRIKWKVKTKVAAVGFVIAGDLVVGNNVGLQAWSLKDGSDVWHTDRKTFANFGLCIDDERIYLPVCTGTQSDRERECHLGCLALKTGKELWRHSEFDLALCGPICTHHYVWHTGRSVVKKQKETSWVIAAEKETGQIVWRYDFPQYPECVIATDKHLVVLARGMLYCFGMDTEVPKKPGKKVNATKNRENKTKDTRCFQHSPEKLSKVKSTMTDSRPGSMEGYIIQLDSVGWFKPFSEQERGAYQAAMSAEPYTEDFWQAIPGLFYDVESVYEEGDYTQLVKELARKSFGLFAPGQIKESWNDLDEDEIEVKVSVQVAGKTVKGEWMQESDYISLDFFELLEKAVRTGKRGLRLQNLGASDDSSGTLIVCDSRAYSEACRAGLIPSTDQS